VPVEYFITLLDSTVSEYVNEYSVLHWPNIQQIKSFIARRDPRSNSTHQKVVNFDPS